MYTSFLAQLYCSFAVPGSVPPCWFRGTRCNPRLARPSCSSRSLTLRSAGRGACPRFCTVLPPVGRRHSGQNVDARNRLLAKARCSSDRRRHRWVCASKLGQLCVYAHFKAFRRSSCVSDGPGSDCGTCSLRVPLFWRRANALTLTLQGWRDCCVH